MKPRTLTCITTMTLFAALAVPVQLAAQDRQQQAQKKKHTRYKLVDIGTFGGPQSTEVDFNQAINNQGTVVGWADTSAPDPFPSACFNFTCFVSHEFQWQNGVLTDLGSLAPGWSSTVGWISDNGLIDATSQNGLIDPLTGIPETRATVYEDGRMIDLGTLGGYESFAIGINSRGQVVGGATNVLSQVRAFLWENGVMQDLGTLGGTDATAYVVNERGQVTGGSYTNSMPNPVSDSCGQNVPTFDPFVWEKGKLIDLGTLGGTCGFGNTINKRGQVVGQSDLAGDVYFHPFLWDRGVLTDLGTFGGNYGSANWLNDAGEIVGYGYYPGDQIFHAVLWKHGVMTDLGTVPGDCCSDASWINSKAQVVGTSGNSDFSVQRAFLWEDGGPMLDLNTLIPAGSPLFLERAFDINDRGEIVGYGLLANGNSRAFLLIPCGEGDEGCEDSAAGTATTTQNSPTSAQPRTAANPALTDGTSGMPYRLRDRRFPGRRTFGPVQANVAGSPQAAASGRIGMTSAPNVTLSPTSLTFAVQLVGATSAAQPVTLTNSGTAPLSITSITPSGDFAETNTCGPSLAAGASCTISVTFTPSERGQRIGKLSIADNAPGSPQSVSLSGTGTVVELNPRRSHFNANCTGGGIPVRCGCTQETLTTTLTNVGKKALSITGITVSSGSHLPTFFQTNTCKSSVAAGASCTISVTFKPASLVGPFIGTISVSDNGGASPQQVPLSGAVHCYTGCGYCQ